MGNILMTLNEIQRNKPLTHKYVVTKPGIFGAEMMVNISNDGPITLIMEF